MLRIVFLKLFIHVIDQVVDLKYKEETVKQRLTQEVSTVDDVEKIFRHRFGIPDDENFSILYFDEPQSKDFVRQAFRAAEDLAGKRRYPDVWSMVKASYNNEYSGFRPRFVAGVFNFNTATRRNSLFWVVPLKEAVWNRNI